MNFELEDNLYPNCGFCNKKVDKLEFFHDFFNNSTVAIAYCHGQQETTTFNNNTRIFFKIEPGTAFNKKQLEFRKLLDKNGE